MLLPAMHAEYLGCPLVLGSVDGGSDLELISQLVCLVGLKHNLRISFDITNQDTLVHVSTVIP